MSARFSLPFFIVRRKEDLRMKREKICLISAVLASLTGCSAFAAGNAPAPTYTLNQVVVTAERIARPDLDTPASTSIITSKEIEDKGYQTVGEALDQTIGITTNAYTAGGEDFGGMSGRSNIRGLDQGTLVLVNGAPTNLFNYASTDGIPVDAVQKIEVIRGSNSVLYGPEAMGGVINIITKTGGAPKTTIKGTYGNYNSEYQIGNQGPGYTIFFGRHYYDKFKDAQRVFPRNPFYTRSMGKGHKDNLFASVKLTDKLTLDWARVETDRTGYYREAWNGHRTNRLSRDPTLGYPGKADYNTIKNNLDLIYNDEGSHFRSILAYNSKRLDTKNIYYRSDGQVDLKEHGSNQHYNIYNFNFDNQKTWFFNDKKDSLTAGASFKYEHYKQLSNGAREFSNHPYYFNFNSTSHRINRKSYGVFASYSHAFNDRLTGILGFREHINQSNGWDEAHHEFLPQFQLNYKLNRNWSFYANVAKSFDLPSIDSKYYMTTLGRDWNTKPQKGWTYEVGSKYISGKDSLKMDVFYMDIKNKFQWLSMNTVVPGSSSMNYIQTNAGKFHNLGFEMEYAHKVNDNWNFNVGASISNPKAKDRSSADWHQTDARVQVKAGLNYTKNKFSAALDYFLTTDREEAYYDFLGRSSIYDIGWRGRDHKIPDRNILNASFRYSPNSDQTISFNMYNMLNRHNPLNDTELYDLPFNWTVSYSLSF